MTPVRSTEPTSGWSCSTVQAPARKKMIHVRNLHSLNAALVLKHTPGLCIKPTANVCHSECGSASLLCYSTTIIPMPARQNVPQIAACDDDDASTSDNSVFAIDREGRDNNRGQHSPPRKRVSLGLDAGTSTTTSHAI